MTSQQAYDYAYYNHTRPGFNLKHYQEIACKHPREAYYFAEDIPGADIKYCQEYVCKDLEWAISFGLDIPGADIEYCRKACGKAEFLLKAFDELIIKKAML